MVGGLDEGVHLPNLFERQSMPKAGHLRPFPAVDHRFGEVVIAKLRREDVRSAGAGAVMTDQALASIDMRPAEMAAGWPMTGLVSPSSACASASGDEPMNKAARRRMKRARADP
jgi:hypothetical protein